MGGRRGLYRSKAGDVRGSKALEGSSAECASSVAGFLGETERRASDVDFSAGREMRPMPDHEEESVRLRYNLGGTMSCDLGIASDAEAYQAAASSTARRQRRRSAASVQQMCMGCSSSHPSAQKTWGRASKTARLGPHGLTST